MGERGSRGSVRLGMMAVLVLVALATSPVTGGAASLTSGGLKQFCAQSMAQLFPEVVERIPGTPYVGTVLALPGKYRQTFGITLETKEVSAECDQAGYRLLGKAIGWLAQPTNHKDLYELDNAYYANHAGKVQSAAPNIASYRRDNYRCTPGPGKTPVWLELVNKVNDPHGHVLAEKTQWHRVPVLNPDRSNAAC